MRAGGGRARTIGPADSCGSLVHRLRVPERGSIEGRGKLLAGTLAEPWRLSATLTGTGPTTARGQEWSFTGRFGDVLRLAITSACPFVPWNPLPALTLGLRCDLPLRDIPPAPPSVPTGLKATVSANGPGTPFVTRLSASAVDPNADDIRFQFEIEARGGTFAGRVGAQSDWRAWTQVSPTVTGTIDRLSL